MRQMHHGSTEVGLLAHNGVQELGGGSHQRNLLLPSTQRVYLLARYKLYTAQN